MRRPFRTRVWFQKPYINPFEDRSMWIKPSWKERLNPLAWGADEFFWHCWSLGYQWTGRVTVAYRECPGPGRCRKPLTEEELEGIDWPVEWPVDCYGHDHVRCTADCCQDVS